jgi:UDP-galactose transporter B1
MCIYITEAAANVVMGLLGLAVTGGSTKNLPLKMFGLAGVTQVSAKAFTSLALANGVSFPVVTLAKSGMLYILG